MKIFKRILAGIGATILTNALAAFFTFCVFDRWQIGIAFCAVLEGGVFVIFLVALCGMLWSYALENK